MSGERRAQREACKPLEADEETEELVAAVEDTQLVD